MPIPIVVGIPDTGVEMANLTLSSNRLIGEDMIRDSMQLNACLTKTEGKISLLGKQKYINGVVPQSTTVRRDQEL
jgi:hypothetical protein